MYKKRNSIRIAAFLILLSIAGLLYFLIYEKENTTMIYILGGVAFIAFVYYIVQMSLFRGKLNRYFEEKGMDWKYDSNDE